MSQPSRRAFLASLSAAAVVPCLSVAHAARPEGMTVLEAPADPSILLARRAAQAAGPEGLTVLAAPANSSILLARAIDAAASAGIAPGLKLETWRSPDELRAGIVSGKAKVFSLPTNVAANLRNRGLPVCLVDVISVGHMMVLTSEPDIGSLTDLRGKRVQLYFRHDMPDLCLRFLLAKAAIDPDREVTLDYAGSPVEAAQLLLSGRATTALLNEPTASSVLLAAKAKGLPIRKAFSLQNEWARITARPPFLPLAGIAATEDIARDHGEFLRALHYEIIGAAAWIVDNRAAAGDLAERTLGFKADAMAASLEKAEITIGGARAERPNLEAFFSALAEQAPGLIGGKLPDDGFYFNL